MKAVKIALLSLLGLIVLLVAVGALLLLPGVQRAVATRIIATEPGESVEIDHLRIGFQRTEIRGFHYEQADASYTIADLNADLSLVDLLLGRAIRIGELVATGVELDLSRMEPDDEEREPFEGILQQMELPMPLHLERARVEGHVLLPGAGAEPMRGDFLLTGGGFAPGQEGELTLTGDLVAPGLDLFSALGLEGDLKIVQAERGRIERARLLAMVSAGGNESERQERLSADVLLLSTADGEAYQASLRRIVAEEATEQPDLSTLIVIDATYQYDEGLLEGRWEIDVDRDQLAAYLAEMELPEFSVQGSGQFSYGVTRDVFDVAGELDLAVADLGTIAAELRELGGFTLNSRFNLSMDEAVFHLEELLVELRDQDERNLLQVRNHQPIRYNLEAQQLEGMEQRLTLAELTVQALPVEWANLFLEPAEGEAGLEVTGGDLAGQLLLSADGGAIFFEFVEPLRAEAISVFSGEEPLLSEVGFEMGGSGSLRDGELAATIEPIRLFHQNQDLLTASGNFNPQTARFEGTLGANLAQWMAQPVLAEMGNLASGELQANIAATFDERIHLEGNGSIRNLVTRDEQQRLPTVQFQALVREIGDQVWEVDLPVQIEGPAPSDVRLSGRIQPGEEINRFDLRLAGQRVILDQVTALGGGFTGVENDTPAAPANERDEVPFWSGWEGRLAVEITQVQLHEEYGIDQLQGELTMRAEEITHDVRANFAESPLEMDFRLRFLETEARPYVLEGTIEAPRVAAGELFRQLQPDRPPTVEGLFAASVVVEGTGRNLPDLIDRVRGQARLQSGGGILRLFYTENPLAGLGIAAGALLGALGGEVGAISQVATRLAHMPYDEMNIAAERDEELNFILRDLTVLSSEMHLRGTGEVRYQEGVEILEQPMELHFRLAARGPLETALAAVRVLGDERDELDYRQMRRDFIIRGTPANPDSTPFYRLLADTVMRFVRPGDVEETEEEERRIIPQIPDVFDFLRGMRGR